VRYNNDNGNIVSININMAAMTTTNDDRDKQQLTASRITRQAMRHWQWHQCRVAVASPLATRLQHLQPRSAVVTAAAELVTMEKN